MVMCLLATSHDSQVCTGTGFTGKSGTPGDKEMFDASQLRDSITQPDLEQVEHTHVYLLPIYYLPSLTPSTVQDGCCKMPH